MKNRVLLVEDEDDLRELMRDALELNGYDVLVARDGLEALEALDRTDGVSAVVLDLVLPRLDGWECYAWIRAHTALADVPVIVHSSIPTEAPSGVAHVLPKPVTLERLVSTLRAHCGG